MEIVEWKQKGSLPASISAMHASGGIHVIKIKSKKNNKKINRQKSFDVTGAWASADQKGSLQIKIFGEDKD